MSTTVFPAMMLAPLAGQQWHQGKHPGMIREMVLSGLGISLSPRWLFAADVRQGTVTTLLDDYQPAALPINAVFSQDRRRSARTRAFVEFLPEHL